MRVRRLRSTLGLALLPLVLALGACGGEEEPRAEAGPELEREMRPPGPEGEGPKESGGAESAPAPEEEAAPEPEAAAPEEGAEPRSAAARARAEVERLRELVAEREAKVEEARGRLREAETRLREIRSETTVPVDDAALFRAVQSELLESPALSHVAIAAEVREGEVILRGVVPDLETLHTAEEVAKGLPGVDSVDNRIDVVPEEDARL